MLLFHYHGLLCTVCHGDFYEFSLVDSTVRLTYFLFLFLEILILNHTSVPGILLPCFLAHVKEQLSTHSISCRYIYCSLANSSTHFVYLPTNLCGIIPFYPKYEGRTYLPGYKLPLSTKSEPWETQISYCASRVISNNNEHIKESAWSVKHHGMNLYRKTDLWFHIFLISKTNGVSVISYTFRHSYPSRKIRRYPLNRTLCGPLR